MRHVPAVLAVLATLWPAALGAALADRVNHTNGLTSGLIYLAASHICHQRPERSFASGGHQWPVCGRCAGLYLAAPIGAWVAAVRRRPTRRARGLLMLASLPTALSVALEWVLPGSVTSGIRFLAALPLGAALAYVLVAASTEGRESIG